MHLLIVIKYVLREEDNKPKPRMAVTFTEPVWSSVRPPVTTRSWFCRVQEWCSLHSHPSERGRFRSVGLLILSL